MLPYPHVYPTMPCVWTHANSLPRALTTSSHRGRKYICKVPPSCPHIQIKQAEDPATPWEDAGSRNPGDEAHKPHRVTQVILSQKILQGRRQHQEKVNLEHAASQAEWRNSRRKCWLPSLRETRAQKRKSDCRKNNYTKKPR